MAHRLKLLLNRPSTFNHLVIRKRGFLAKIDCNLLVVSEGKHMIRDRRYMETLQMVAGAFKVRPTSDRMGAPSGAPLV